MPKFVNIDRDTELLLPPNLRDRVHFVMDAVGLLDVSEASVNQRGTGSEQYPPRLLLGLLVYSYAPGLFSSRQIERATYENVAVRLLCADTRPDHDTLCAFRQKRSALAPGYDPVFGARPLKRFLQRHVETKLARALVVGEVADGSRLCSPSSTTILG